MRKISLLLLIAICISCFFACNGNEKNLDSGSSNSSVSNVISSAESGFEGGAETSDSTTPQNVLQDSDTLVLHINIDSQYSFDVMVIYDSQEETLAKELLITDSLSANVFQRLAIEENESFEKKAYAIDVNFDGNKDILIPYNKTAKGVYYMAYVWDIRNHAFVYASEFKNLPNFVLDNENKQVLTKTANDMLVTYGVACYEEAISDYVITNSLYYEYLVDEVEGDKIHFVEYNSFNEIIAEYYMQGNENYYMVDETDERMVPYLEQGSFWDLYSEKWNRIVISVEE